MSGHMGRSGVEHEPKWALYGEKSTGLYVAVKCTVEGCHMVGVCGVEEVPQ